MLCLACEENSITRTPLTDRLTIGQSVEGGVENALEGADVGEQHGPVVPVVRAVEGALPPAGRLRDEPLLLLP